MTNPETTLDPRRNAYRADLADARLEGQVEATRFVAGTRMQVRQPSLPMLKAPDPALGLENEALFGEIVTVFDTAGGWAWGQLERDGYVGYLPADGLTEMIREPTHRVRVPGALVYPRPSAKVPPMAHLGLNARLRVAGPANDERFVGLETGGYVCVRHLCPIDAFATDFVDIAEQFLHTPYFWGGRTRLGLDCSGLVQLSLEAAGIDCPRDSDLAVAELGEPAAVADDLDGLARGDVVYWRGHCGIMVDGVLLLHANAHHMSTVIEPLSVVVRRARRATGADASGREISAVRRLTERGVSRG